MRSEIDRDFGHLCSTNAKLTDQLFGDHLFAELKDIFAVNQMSIKIKSG